MNNTPIDYEKAKLDPSAVFTCPEEIGQHAGLTRKQKIEILRRWEYDACELEVAEEEGMIATEPSLLARILAELKALAVGLDTEHSPPTKQRGLSSSDINN